MQKMIAVDEETYEKLKALAEANGRTIGGQVKWLLKDVDLPHPAADAPVPVIYPIKSER